MRIAIAGFGDFGRRFLDVFARSEHNIVVLTQQKKAGLNVSPAECRPTDYSVESLTQLLDDCDAIISTLSGPPDFYISAHLNILKACQRTKNCKHFIPSEWNINLEDFPDQPMFSAATHEVVRERLRSQKEVKWTMICHGWTMEYILPNGSNPLREIGDAWVMNHETKVFDMYGDGAQFISLTSINDVALASLAILQHSIANGKDLPPVTLLSGQTITYRALFNLVRQRDSAWKEKRVMLSEVVDAIVKGKQQNDPKVAIHQMRLLGFTTVNYNPDEKVLPWKSGALQGLTPTTIEELLDQHSS